MASPHAETISARRDSGARSSTPRSHSLALRSHEAETSIWKMVTRVMRERELTLIREAGEAFAHAGELAERQAAGRAKADPERARLGFVHERVAQLGSLAALGERLLEGIVAGEAIDPTPLKEASARSKAG